MEQYRKTLGKVVLTCNDYWDKNKNYDILCLVEDKDTNKNYISKKEVPAGVLITNREYWQPIASMGAIDNGIIILNHTDINGNIPYYDLISAAKSINTKDRRPGLVLGYLNYNPSSNDLPQWKLYQYNDVDLANWLNISSWQALDYNKGFIGWFPNEEELYKEYGHPKYGMYAYVGEVAIASVIYRADDKNDWVNTGEKAFNYIVNFADEEDITNKNNTIKFADKTYNPEKFSGLGRVYLRKNIVDGVNVLTQDMMTKVNTIYIIQYDYDLRGAEITIPEGCVLDFQGGVIENGLLKSTSSQTFKATDLGLKPNDITFAEYNFIQLKMFLSNTLYNIDFENKCFYVSDDSKNHIDINRTLTLFNGTIISNNLSFIPKSGSSFIFKNLSFISDNIFEKTTSTTAKDEYLMTNKNLNPIIGWQENTGIETNALIIDINIDNCCFYKYEAIGLMFEDLDANNIDFGIKSLNVTNCIFDECFTPIYIGGARYWNICNISNNTATNIYGCFVCIGTDNNHTNSNIDASLNCPIVLNNNIVKGKTTSINWYHCAFLVEQDTVYCTNNVIENFINIQERVANISGTAYESYLSCTNVFFSNNICRNIMSSRRYNGNYNDKPLLRGNCEIAKAKAGKRQFIINNTWIYNKEYLLSQGCIEEDLQTNIFGFTSYIETYHFEGNTIDAIGITVSITNNGKNLKCFEMKNNKFRTYKYNGILKINHFYAGSSLHIKNNIFDTDIESDVFFGLRPDNAEDNRSISISIVDNNVNGYLAAYIISSTYNIQNNIKYEFARNIYSQYPISEFKKYDKDSISGINPTGVMIENNYVIHESTSLYYNTYMGSSDNILYKMLMSSDCTRIRLPRLNKINETFKYSCYKINLTVDGINHVLYCNTIDSPTIYTAYGDVKKLTSSSYTISTLYDNLNFQAMLLSDGSIRFDVVKKDEITDSIKVEFGLVGVSDKELSLITNVSELPNIPMKGIQYFLNTLNKPIWWTGKQWIDALANDITFTTEGSFSNKPISPVIGFAYFCTDRKTTEGAVNGIMIYHKGKDVWVDALGRVVE